MYLRKVPGKQTTKTVTQLTPVARPGQPLDPDQIIRQINQKKVRETMRSYTITNYDNSQTAGFTDFVGLSLTQNFGVQADDFPSLIPFVGPAIRSSSDSDQFVNAVLAHTGWNEPDIVEHDNEFITMIYND